MRVSKGGKSCSLLVLKIILSDLRFAYMDRKDVLLEVNLPTKNPFTLFDLWFKEALADETCYEPNAMCISTVDRCVVH